MEILNSDEIKEKMGKNFTQMAIDFNEIIDKLDLKELEMALNLLRNTMVVETAVDIKDINSFIQECLAPSLITFLPTLVIYDLLKMDVRPTKKGQLAPTYSLKNRIDNKPPKEVV